VEGEQLMRVLTVKQPWAWAIIHGGKDVENRGRNLAGDYRGLVAIHVGLTYDQGADDSDASWEIRRAITAEEQGHPADDGQVWDSEVIDELDSRFSGRGIIIGVVDLTSVHHAEDCFDGAHWINHSQARFCSPWAQHGAHHLALGNARTLTEPIPWKGALGMRTLPEDTARLVLERVLL
jgi:hypothetical protein